MKKFLSRKPSCTTEVIVYNYLFLKSRGKKDICIFLYICFINFGRIFRISKTRATSVVR